MRTAVPSFKTKFGINSVSSLLLERKGKTLCLLWPESMEVPNEMLY